MFLIFFEDGEVKKSEELDAEHYSACDDGFISIIDISAEKPLEYYEGEWHEVEDIDDQY